MGFGPVVWLIASAYAPVLGLMAAGMAIHCLPERYKVSYRRHSPSRYGCSDHICSHWLGIRRCPPVYSRLSISSSELLRDLHLLVGTAGLCVVHEVANTAMVNTPKSR